MLNYNDVNKVIILGIIMTNIRTTLSLSSELLEATDQAVRAGKAKSRNELVARALKRELAAIEKAEIDNALAEMTLDPDYQAQVLKMEAEFAPASWEAFRDGFGLI